MALNYYGAGSALQGINSVLLPLMQRKQEEEELRKRLRLQQAMDLQRAMEEMKMKQAMGLSAQLGKERELGADISQLFPQGQIRLGEAGQYPIPSTILPSQLGRLGSMVGLPKYTPSLPEGLIPSKFTSPTGITFELPEPPKEWKPTTRQEFEEAEKFKAGLKEEKPTPTYKIIQDKNSPTGWSYADITTGEIKQTGAPVPSTAKPALDKYWSDSGKLYKLNPETNQFEVVFAPIDDYEISLQNAVATVQKGGDIEKIFAKLLVAFPTNAKELEELKFILESQPQGK